MLPLQPDTQPHLKWEAFILSLQLHGNVKLSTNYRCCVQAAMEEHQSVVAIFMARCSWHSPLPMAKPYPELRTMVGRGGGCGCLRTDKHWQASI